ncbi:hypothetical protein BS78_K015300 [Paspalum vaginatum]|uniref:Uncharacterized protein n=1 Tax=Paspalum vaginatum TaxID=158149 RepID=A0A9W7XDC8_9POAL|nr:hypothetical protein BS78_K015300 [Paspalum vaginatum]
MSPKAAPAEVDRNLPGAVQGSEERGPGMDLGLVGETKFLEGELVACLCEVGEDNGVGEVVHCVGEARVDPSQEVEDELRVLHGMADIVEGVSRCLHALTGISDGGVALLHAVELVAEEDGPRFLVGAEEVFDGLV